MIDLEGLEDIEESVIAAIIEGAQKKDGPIHPDLNSSSHPVAKPEEASQTSQGEPAWVEKIKKKIEEIRKKDPEIYPLF